MSVDASAGREVPGISIVVPTFNEAAAVQRLQDQLDGMDLASEGCEVLFADSESSDGTPGLVRAPYRLVSIPGRGRGRALNAGAEASSGEVILFLHCDSVLPPRALEELRRVMAHHRAGCFGIRFDARSPVLLLCQVLSNARVRFRDLAYGDQGLFIERGLFFEMGGFADLPFMEDYQFALDLKARGVRLGMTRHRITTSARRFPPGERAKLDTWREMYDLRRRYREGASPEELREGYPDAR